MLGVWGGEMRDGVMHEWPAHILIGQVLQQTYPRMGLWQAQSDI